MKMIRFLLIISLCTTVIMIKSAERKKRSATFYPYSPYSSFSEGESSDGSYDYKFQKTLPKHYEDPNVVAYHIPHQTNEIVYKSVVPKIIPHGQAKPLSLAYHPNGKKLAVGLGTRLLKLVEVKNLGNEIEFQGHRAAVVAVTFDKEGNSILSGSRDRSIIRWDINKRQAAGLWTVPGWIGSVAYKPDNDNLILFSLIHHDQEAVVSFVDEPSFSALGFTDIRQSRVDWLGGHKGGVYKAVYNPSRPSEIISLGSDRKMMIWDVRQLKTSILNEEIPGTTFALNDKGDQLAVQIAPGKIKFYRLKEGSWQGIAHLTLKDNDNKVSPALIEAMTYTPEGADIAIGHEGIITMWDTHFATQPSDIGAHDYPISAIVSNPAKPSQIASADLSDCPLRIWKITKSIKVVANTHENYVVPAFENGGAEEKPIEKTLDMDQLFNLNAFGNMPNEASS